MDKKLLDRIQYIFVNCHSLIESAFGKDYPVAGNIGIFSQGDKEYQTFKLISEGLIKRSDNPNQKYFELKKELRLTDGDYAAIFTHVYIRKYDPSEYGRNKGDVDFVAGEEEYSFLKNKVRNSEYKGAAMYNRPGWDTIQITETGIDVVSYLCTRKMAEKVRVKFDSLTNL
ncbi:MAG: hypothetical protein PHS44_05435 [Candidatus Dojkabacteria bacterium]|jgi:hypothetical protein|nr:hypothetical protein [Candidatus Dojkabacteria bacterium]